MTEEDDRSAADHQRELEERRYREWAQKLYDDSIYELWSQAYRNESEEMQCKELSKP